MTALFVALIITVVLVNGWTDAPSSVAGCISGRAFSPPVALKVAAVCNFLGAVSMAVINPSVAKTVYGIADFEGGKEIAVCSICAGLLSVILWAVITAKVGIPTSESHALISGLTGAAVANGMSLDVIQREEWKAVLIGLLMATLPTALLAFILYRLTLKIFADQNRRGAMQYFVRAQRIGACCGAFMHGAQDSQKFMGVYLLGISVLSDKSYGNMERIPLYVVLSCATVMTAGTLFGGMKIIKKVGCDMTALDAAGGSTADTASSAVMAVCSFVGIPAATTQAKSCAMMGVGISQKNGIDAKIAAELIVAWILTFPVCGGIGFTVSYISLLFLR